MKNLINFHFETDGLCMHGPEPCPVRTCRHHLHGDAKPDQVASAPVPMVTCVLKIAGRGGMTLEEVGISMGLTRERVRQIAEKGLVHLRRNMQRDGLIGAKFHDD